MNQKNIKEYIKALDHLKGFLMKLLDEENKVFLNIEKNERDKISELTELRMLSKSDVWPEAVPTDLICAEDEKEKMQRAYGIIHNTIGTDIKEKKVLDFGCGEGHVVIASASYETVLSVGYDLKKDESTWGNGENFIMTKEWEEVLKLGPFDAILINDVIDHSESPKDVLIKAKQVKSQTGKIFLRVHPWTSRHATHLYKTLNKAYLHIIFSEEELISMGLDGLKTKKILNPLEYYNLLIKEVGLTILKEEKIKQQIEIFFTHTDEILKRIKKNWPNQEFKKEELETQFIDFVLI